MPLRKHYPGRNRLASRRLPARRQTPSRQTMRRPLRPHGRADTGAGPRTRYLSSPAPGAKGAWLITPTSRRRAHRWQAHRRCLLIPPFLGVPRPTTMSNPPKLSHLSKVSPISIYVSILITLAPVLGKRLITLPTTVITMITLLPCCPRQHRLSALPASPGKVSLSSKVSGVVTVVLLAGPLGPLDAGAGQTRTSPLAFLLPLGHLSFLGSHQAGTGILADGRHANRPYYSSGWK